MTRMILRISLFGFLYFIVCGLLLHSHAVFAEDKDVILFFNSSYDEPTDEDIIVNYELSKLISHMVGSHGNILVETIHMFDSDGDAFTDNILNRTINGNNNILGIIFSFHGYKHGILLKRSLVSGRSIEELTGPDDFSQQLISVISILKNHLKQEFFLYFMSCNLSAKCKDDDNFIQSIQTKIFNYVHSINKEVAIISHPFTSMKGIFYSHSKGDLGLTNTNDDQLDQLIDHGLSKLFLFLAGSDTYDFIASRPILNKTLKFISNNYFLYSLSSLGILGYYTYDHPGRLIITFLTGALVNALLLRLKTTEVQLITSKDTSLRTGYVKRVLLEVVQNAINSHRCEEVIRAKKL